MRAAIYARYSSERQSDGYTIETQLEACRDALPADAKITGYVDRAKSGSTLAGRAALRKLLDAAGQKRFDVVLVYKFDRLGRNQAETATIVQDLEEAGVQVRSATEGDDPLARGMHLVFAEHFNRQLAERTRAGCLKAAAAGRIGGPAPFGYRRDGDGHLEADPATAPIAKRIFRAYASGGKSYKAICRELNGDGIPSPRGGIWHAGSVLEILRNESYAGRATFNVRRFARDRRTGRRRYVKNPRSEWIMKEVLALVSPDTWAAVQARRKTRAAKPGDTRRTYPLSGLVTCAACGRGYVAQKSTNAKGEYVYLSCGDRAAGGACENRFRFRQDIVLPELVAQLQDVLFSRETTDTLTRTLTRLAVERLGNADREREELKERIADVERKIQATLELALELKTHGQAVGAAVHAKLDTLNKNVEALQERLAEVERGPRLDLPHLEATIRKNIRKQRDGLLEIREPQRIREALRVLVGKIVAHPDGRLAYETSPVSLLTEDASRAFPRDDGSGGVLLTLRERDGKTFSIVRRTLDYHTIRARKIKTA